MNALEVYQWHTRAAISRPESMPVTEEWTDSERLNWLGECAEKMYWRKPTVTHSGKFVIVDSMGQVTAEANLRDAIDSAVDKLNGANS